MSLCFSSNVFTLQSPKCQIFSRTRLSSQFVNPIQVKSAPYTLADYHVNLSQLFKFSSKRLNPITASAATTALEANPSSFRNKNPKDINILVVGSTGYIGKFVVKELVNRGFNVIAIARERSGIRGRNDKEETLNQLQGPNAFFSDVTDLGTLEKSLENLRVSIDFVVSCLASRTGGAKDSWKIDYEATMNSLVAGRH